MSDDPRAILTAARTVAVVGCSTHPGKAAHSIPRALQAAGFRILPVHPTADEILGVPAHARLADLDEPVDLVVVFRPSAQAAGVVRQAADIGAGAVWLQQGIRSEEGRAIAREAGMGYVEDRCSGVDAMRWGIRLS